MMWPFSKISAQFGAAKQCGPGRSTSITRLLNWSAIKVLPGELKLPSFAAAIWRTSASVCEFYRKTSYQTASMQIADQCDAIGTTLLLSDADLALTIIRIALSRPAGERRATAIQNAKTAFRRICELASSVHMEPDAIQNLSTKLEAIRFALDEAEGTVVPVQT